MSRICVNVLSVINSASNITSEIIDGVEHIVVKDVCPVIDDIVLNGGLYPADEISKGYQSLEGKPMPYGHPKIEGQYVSASNVRAVNEYHIGAFARNVRKDGDRVLMDMCVNRRYAEATDKGKEVVNRLDDMKAGKEVEPVGVSTGLDLNRSAGKGVSKGKKYNWIARNHAYDHCAILLHETPAGTPREGVGIFVNAAGEELQIETVSLADSTDCTREGWFNKVLFHFSTNSQLSHSEIYEAISNVLNAGREFDIRRWIESIYPNYFIYEDGPKKFKQSYLIDESQTAQLVGEPTEVIKKVEYDEVKTNGELNPMKDMITNALKAAGKPTDGKTEAELLDAYNQLMAKPADTTVNTDAITAAVNAAVKPLSDELAGLKTQLAANADKELAIKRAAVKAKFKLEDAAVNTLAGEALDGLFAQTQSTIGINGAFNHGDAQDDMADYIPGKVA
ncbi:TPA: DUF2213 domain-containing protein [Yersinia enterocolitica]